jgi:hypothetical protein
LCERSASKYCFVIKLFKKRSIFPPFPFLRRLKPAGGFGALRLNLAFSPRAKVAGFRRRAEGGGLGSPLTGFSPNTGISFLMISPKLLDICPVFLLVFSPIKTADLLIYYSSLQVMAILCCVAKKAASVAHIPFYLCKGLVAICHSFLLLFPYTIHYRTWYSRFTSHSLI